MLKPFLALTISLSSLAAPAGTTAPAVQLTTADFAGLWDFKINPSNGGLPSVYIFYLYADGTLDVAAENYNLGGTFSIDKNNLFSMKLDRLFDSEKELTPDYQNFTSAPTPATKDTIYGTMEEVQSSNDFPYDHFFGFEAHPHNLTFATSLANVQVQTNGTFSASEKITRTFKKGVAFDSGSFSMTAEIPFPKKSINNQIIDQYSRVLLSFGNFHSLFDPLDDPRYVPDASKFKVSYGDNDVDNTIQLSFDVSDSETMKLKLKVKYIHEAGKPPHGASLLGRTLLGQPSASSSSQIPILIEYSNNSCQLQGTSTITVKTDSKGQSKIATTLKTAGAK